MSSIRWQTLEALGAAYYIEKGYSVLVPFGDRTYYDFVVEKDGKCLRVNVKKAYRDRGSYRISLSGSAIGIERKASVDVYLAVIPERNCFIELGGDFFDQSKSRARVVPKEIVEQVCNLQNQSSYKSSQTEASKPSQQPQKRSCKSSTNLKSGKK